MIDVLTEDFRQTPYWWDAAPPEPAAAAIPEATDVAIIGSGYTGLCCAIELAGHGVGTVVLEAGDLGAGASTRSGGMVTGGQKLVVSGATHGIAPERRARLLEDAHESLAMLEQRIADYRLDAEYERYGRLILAHIPRHYERLVRWAELLRRAGSAVSLLSREALAGEVGGTRYHGGLLIEDYGGLHPAKYHRALRRAACDRGAVLASHAAVGAIRRLAEGFEVVTGRGVLRARSVVVGTNGYTGPLIPHLQRRVVPVTAYVIATEPLPPGLPEKLIPHRRMLSDTKRQLYWIRLSPDGTRMIFGARPHLVDTDTQTAARSMHGMLAGVWPELADVRISHCWTGNVAMSVDHLPHMGVHDGIHYALGCNGSGVAMMSYLGQQTARKILGTQNRPCAFDSADFPPFPLYRGWPWFVPLVAAWRRLRDKLESR
ncbi:MAG: FAD-binding oxidoreductase [Acidisphaera sp.]|nr:FAD-binding oxidoreductase [Acidisphaera sp.]